MFIDILKFALYPFNIAYREDLDPNAMPSDDERSMNIITRVSQGICFSIVLCLTCMLMDQRRQREERRREGMRMLVEFD